MNSPGGPNSRPITIVTPTYNRRQLLERLYASLAGQSDFRFEWHVVDDASSDDTVSWVHAQQAHAPFTIRISVNSKNRGKCASLNHAFAATQSDFSLVVDSDDQLMPGAVRLVHEVLAGRVDDQRVGAVFFAYHDQLGNQIGSPPNGRDTFMFRSAFDQTYGKYDGCVGYYRAVTDKYRYPEFENETYVGPTVLQLIMEPEFKVLFVRDVIGIAEYQGDGLTASGRALRIRNPQGMMVYSRLVANRSTRWLTSAKYRISYYAYSHILSRSGIDAANNDRPRGGLAPVDRFLGRLLVRNWLKNEKASE